MATKKKNTDKEIQLTMTAKSPRGITPEARRDGSVVQIVSVGTKERRRTFRFDTEEICKDFRARYYELEPAFLAAGEPPLTKEQFLRKRETPPLPTVQSLVAPPMALFRMLDDRSEFLFEGTTQSVETSTYLHALKRYFLEVEERRKTSASKSETDLDGSGKQSKRQRSGKKASFVIKDAIGAINLNAPLNESERGRVQTYYRHQCDTARGLEETSKLQADEVTREEAEGLRSWLVNENYDSTFQSAVLGLAYRIWATALVHKHVSSNIFTEVRPLKRTPLPRFNRKGQDRSIEDARPYTAFELAAMARMLRPVYRLSYWYCLLIGYRRSEPFGIRIGQWDSENREIYLDLQRRGSPAAGASKLKTEGSERPTLVYRQLADATDRYILENHGPRPTDPDELEEWNNRLLFKGVMGGPMDPASFAKAVKKAAEAVGMTEEALGRCKPVHHLRITLGSLLRGRKDVAARAVSLLLGHKVANFEPEERAGKSTDRYYNRVVKGEMEQLVSVVEEWIDSELLPALGSVDLLELAEFADPVSLEEAAQILSTSGTKMAVDDVLSFVTSGDILSDRLNYTNELDRQAPVVSLKTVNAVLSQLVTNSSTTYSASEAAAILRIDHSRLYGLLADGKVTELPTISKSRRRAPGLGTGMLPGGGRRFEREGVDRLAEEQAERISIVKAWWTVGEAAEDLRLSEDVMRKLADEGAITMYRDPWTTHKVRYLCPVSVRAYAERTAEVTMEEAARMLGGTQKLIRALAKVGDLEVGKRKGAIRKASVLAYLSTREHAPAPSDHSKTDAASDAT